MPGFFHHDLRLLNPRFSSPLLDVMTELEHLRRLRVEGSMPTPVLVQLKRVFHLLESLASARIEGNQTTLADFVEATVTPANEPAEALREIVNIERSMLHVEESVSAGAELSEHLLRGLHAATVEGLVREGDRTPGAYRNGPVRIAQVRHQPPDASTVAGYMAELVTFVNRADAPKYDLMKIALAHHRFAWIHPFGTGNGRVVRLFTHALLLKYGFQVSTEAGATGRLLNPAAVFCADLERYYAMLAQADSGRDEDLEAWCTYVLGGVLTELRKLDRLTDHRYLVSRVLLPAVAHARERQLVTAQEAAVLSIAARTGIVKAGDLAAAMPGLNATQRTYQVRKLVDTGLLRPIQAGARQYSLGFTHTVLLRGVVKALGEEGLVSAALAQPPS